MIEVEDAEPRRSAGVELLRFAFGFGACVGGIIFAIVVWAIVAGVADKTIWPVGAVLVGLGGGVGMFLGYGRHGDVSAGVIAAVLALVGAFVGKVAASVVIDDPLYVGRGTVGMIVLAAVIAFGIAYGTLGGDD